MELSDTHKWALQKYFNGEYGDWPLHELMTVMKPDVKLFLQVPQEMALYLKWADGTITKHEAHNYAECVEANIVEIARHKLVKQMIYDPFIGFIDYDG